MDFVVGSGSEEIPLTARLPMPISNKAVNTNIISDSSHCLKPLYHDCYKTACPLEPIQSLTQGCLIHLHAASLC